MLRIAENSNIGVLFKIFKCKYWNCMNDDHENRFHQGISAMEARYQDRWLTNMLIITIVFLLEMLL